MRNTLVLMTLLLASFAAAQDTAGGQLGAESADALVASALAESPGYTKPVLDASGAPIYLLADLDLDDRDDLVLLTIIPTQGVSATVGELRSRSRLYDDDAVEVIFHLEVYRGGSEGVLIVDLGPRFVLGAVELIAVTERAYAVKTAFTGRRGSDVELVSMSTDGRLARASYHVTTGENGFLLDVNNDGRIDLVRSVESPEAGRGFETFLELLEYGDGSFERTAAIAVVRTIETFLDRTRNLIVHRDWDTLASLVVGGSARGAAEVLAAAFPPLTDSDVSFDFPSGEYEITDTVFPQIRENPLPVPYLGTSFPILMRVDCCENGSRYYQARIRFPDDPFAGETLAFLTEPESGK